MRELTIKLTIRPHQFAVGRSFAVTNGWRPTPVRILSRNVNPDDIIAAPLPMRGGMRLVAYNRSDLEAEVWISIDLPEEVEYGRRKLLKSSASRRAR